MMNQEQRRAGKLPGADTGIETRRSFCDICAPGPHCGVTCYVKDGRIVRVEGTDGHPAGNGRLCTRGLANRQYVYREDRVLTPLKRIGRRGEGRFAPISWEEAMGEIAARLSAVREEYGPSAAAFYSGYNKWYRPFLQRLCYSFGSVNYGTESSSCFTSTIMSWRLAAGTDFAGPDLKNAGIFLGWGYNACYSGYLQYAAVDRARQRGMKVIIVDPRITPAVEKQCDLHLRIRPGTDGALALGIARELIVNGWIDRAYIGKYVHGFEEYRTYVMTFDPERVEALTDVPASQLRLAARMIHENAPLAVYQSGAALVHHRNGMQNHRAVMALTAVTGSFGRPGGMLPGALTYAHSMAGFRTGDHDFAAEVCPKDQPRPVGAARFPLWDALVGEMQANDLARQILTGKPYPVRALWAHGMNYRMFSADRDFPEAFRQLDLFVDIDLFLTDTAKYADFVLPCCSSFERGEFKVFPGGFAQITEPVIEPLGQARPDDRILMDLAERLELEDPLLRAGTEACLRYMLRDTPVDLDALMTDRQHPRKVFDPPPPPAEPVFATPTGKYELYSTVIGDRFDGIDPLPAYRDWNGPEAGEYPFLLVTGARLSHALHSRLHDVPWLRSLRPAPMAELNDGDAAAMGIAAGDPVEIRTRAGQVTAAVLLTFTVKPGTVHLYHGYREADANSLVPMDHCDPCSGFPGYRSVPCDVRRKEGGV